MSYLDEENEDAEADLPSSPSQKQSLTFIQTHKLSPLQKRLKRISTKAVDVLEAILDGKESSPKEKMDASDKLLKMYIDVTKELNNDSLKRTLLQIKVDGGLVSKEKEIEDDGSPSVMFMPDVIVDNDNVAKGGRKAITMLDSGGVELDLSKADLSKL